MYEGVLVGESLKVGAELRGIPLVVGKVSRVGVSGGTAEQPPVWTLVEFGVADEHAEGLAEVLSEVLDSPGWYADFRDEHEVFVVFPGKVFRYRRGDEEARAEAQAFGRALGIPEPQLDWTT